MDVPIAHSHQPLAISARSVEKLVAHLRQRGQAVHVPRQLSHDHAPQAPEPPLGFGEVLGFLAFPLRVEAAAQTVGKHPIDDERRHVQPGLAQQPGRTRGFVDGQTLRNRDEHE